jgi:hypothetical protein
MYYRKKEKLYLHEIMEDPAITYPSYYTLSHTMTKNEMLHSALISIHMLDFSFYQEPESFDEIFKMCSSGAFPLYKEKYIIGYFGNKMMYLESHGWKAMPVTKELFILSNWLVY